MSPAATSLPGRAVRCSATLLCLALLTTLLDAQTPSSPGSSSAGIPPPPEGGFEGPPPDDAQDGPPRPPPHKRVDFKLSGVLTIGAGAKKTEITKKYASDKNDVSAIFVEGGGDLTLISPTIVTKGDTSSDEASSFFGLNAAVLAAKGGTARLSGGSIVTSGSGANGAFATDPGSTLTLSGTKIVATNDGGHGVMVSNQGAMVLTDVDIETAGAHSAGIATDRGGGTISAVSCKVSTTGQASPALYSTGALTVSGGTLTALGSEAAVIEGQNTITLKNAQLSGSRLRGVMLYQSFSGDAEGRTASFTMEGGAITAHEGPLFYVTNATGVITLSRVNTYAASGVLVDASAGRWGRKGSNGGTAILNASNQPLTGDLVCDSISSIRATLKSKSSLTGRIQGASLALDASSSWQVTGDSTVAVFTSAAPLSGNTISNVRGNGFTVRYDATQPDNAWLKGKTYKLADGGQLTPAN